jgi:cold shock protein
MEAAEALLQSVTKEQRQKGFVRWFDNSKGYGFIQRSDGEADVFVHHSAIIMKGYRTLTENQPVEFDVYTSPKGLIATNVVPQG